MADTERTKSELLAIFANGQPAGSIDPQDMRDYVVTTDIVNTRFSTGLIDGGEVTINAGDDSKFDVAEGSGFYVDNFTDPENPVRLKVSWSDFVAETVTNIATKAETFLGLDLSTGIAVLVLQTASFTVTQSRVIVSLVTLIHPDMATISAISSQYNNAFDVQKNVEDLARFIMSINIFGNSYSENGANLLINKSAGETFNLGINYNVSKQAPNNVISFMLTGLTFTYVHQDGGGDFTLIPSQTLIDPEQFDDGSGTLATISNNTFTTQRIGFSTALNETTIQYGQDSYMTLQDAINAINTEPFAFAPAVTNGFRCWLIVKKGVTDLTAAVAASDARFIQAGRFGDVLRV